MSRDVAQRDQDLAGFRLLKVGDPKEAGDVTRTDNTTVPQANATTGFAGQSLLAAPADHVHPVASNHFPYVLSFSDVSEQAQVGPDETVVAEFPVEFPPLPLGSLIATLAALVSVDAGTATFNLRLGTTAPGVVDGPILATITTVSAQFEEKGFSSNAFERPDGPAIFKVTAATDQPTATCRIKSKTVVVKTI